jgi:hypothetical protein
MKRSIAIGSIFGLALGLMAAPVRAQAVSQGAADQSAPPTAFDVVRSRSRHITANREVVVVTRMHAGRRWWGQRKYQVITVYYDGTRYYRRYFAGPVLRRVFVYQWNGQYYLDEAHWNRYGKRDYDRDHRDYDRDHDRDHRDYDRDHDHDRGHDHDHDRDD